MTRKVQNKLMHPMRPIARLWYRYWNKFKFKFLGVSLGQRSYIVNKVFVHIGEKAEVRIGSNFLLNSGDNINPICSDMHCSIYVEDNAKLLIGDWTGISGGCVWATDSITIGNHVNVGANCVIMDGDIHNTDWKLRHIDRTSEAKVPYKHRPITIEDDVWLGANCIVLKGVTIGARTIIGAGSVVTKDIPSDCIAAGNPCKIIKQIHSGHK